MCPPSLCDYVLAVAMYAYIHMCVFVCESNRITVNSAFSHMRRNRGGAGGAGSPLACMVEGQSPHTLKLPLLQYL